MNFLKKGKEFLDKYPRILNVASAVNNFVCFNRIYGKNKNRIIKKGAFMRGCKVLIRGYGNEIIFGEKSYINNTIITITGNNNTIIIGDDCLLFKASVYIEDDYNRLTIGNKTSIFGPSHIALIEGTTVEIGVDSMFSSDTVIRTGDSHSIIDENGIRINNSEDVKIGNHTWVGNKVIILKGAEVANNTIIGTGAIVTKKFKNSFVAIGGVPAKIIKTDINWDRRRI